MGHELLNGRSLIALLFFLVVILVLLRDLVDLEVVLIGTLHDDVVAVLLLEQAR